MYSLPPRLAEIYQPLVRSFKRRLLLCAVLFYAVALIDYRVNGPHGAMTVTVFVASPILLACIALIILRTKRRSIALGFICPRCGKALYNGRYRHIGRSGECPHCKQFVADELNEKLGQPRPVLDPQSGL
jgi:uncharacterized membrane protein